MIIAWNVSQPTDLTCRDTSAFTLKLTNHMLPSPPLHPSPLRRWKGWPSSCKVKAGISPTQQNCRVGDEDRVYELTAVSTADVPVLQGCRDNVRRKNKSWSQRGREMGGEEDKSEGKEVESVRGGEREEGWLPSRCWVILLLSFCVLFKFFVV